MITLHNLPKENIWNWWCTLMHSRELDFHASGCLDSTTAQNVTTAYQTSPQRFKLKLPEREDRSGTLEEAMRLPFSWKVTEGSDWSSNIQMNTWVQYVQYQEKYTTVYINLTCCMETVCFQMTQRSPRALQRAAHDTRSNYRTLDPTGGSIVVHPSLNNILAEGYFSLSPDDELHL